MEDISVNGPGSPVSLKKVLKSPSIQLRELNVFVTNDTHIVKDAEDVSYITADMCKEQALYFLDTFFKGKLIPHYAFHHILYLFSERNRDVYKEYPDSISVKLSVISKKLTDDSEDYKFVLNKFTYGREDPEFLQCLGMIQLIGSYLKLGAQRIYIEHPETHLHPKRQSKFMTMMQNIRKEYECKPGPALKYNPETASLELDPDSTSPDTTNPE